MLDVALVVTAQYFSHTVTGSRRFDASPAMVRATQKPGVPTKLMTFQQVDFDSTFDGIWACASLLHVPRAEIEDVLHRFARALKPQGVLLITLKEGCGEGLAEDGRFFAYYQLDEFAQILLHIGGWSDLDARRVVDARQRAISQFSCSQDRSWRGQRNPSI